MTMPGTQDMALLSPLTNIHQYTTLVESFPRLDASEEKRLARRLQRDEDLDAARQLITSHLRYVIYIARGYTGYGLPQEDIIQEGNIGLMQAVRRFDPTRGVRLVSYATIWIRAQIHDFIMKNWRIVKFATTKAKRRLFYKLRSAKKRLEWLKQAEANEIADALDVAADDVIDMDGKLYSRDVPFDHPADVSDEEHWAPAAFIADKRFEPAELVAEADFLDTASTALQSALQTLDARSRHIIEARWLAEDDNKLTLQDLGDRYGISAERVRQIEVAAINCLRDAMRSVARLAGA
jgi:RNA polymerase sigma-32 factor